MAGQRSRHRYQCRKCRREGRHYKFTLRCGAKRIKCPCCKSDDVYDAEAYYQGVERRRKLRTPTCFCSPVPFPHRQGSHKWCVHHPAANEPLTRDEEEHMQEVWSNPRRTSCL